MPPWRVNLQWLFNLETQGYGRLWAFLFCFLFPFVKNTETPDWKPRDSPASILSLSSCAPLSHVEKHTPTFEIGFCSKHQEKKERSVGFYLTFCCNLCGCVTLIQLWNLKTLMLKRILETILSTRWPGLHSMLWMRNLQWFSLWPQEAIPWIDGLSHLWTGYRTNS